MSNLLLLFTFAKIGLFTIGGGYAMIPLMQSELTRLGLITTDQLINFIAISEATPGPFAVNVATFVGAESGGILGSAFATLGVILPSYIIILLVARFFNSFQDNFYVRGALSGLRPAVVGLIASAVFSIGMKVLFPAFSFSHLAGLLQPNLKELGILAAAALLRFKFKLHPILIIAISAALGILLFGLLA